ncbi:MAG: precorrin-6A reductase [Hominilimicola sp.]
MYDVILFGGTDEGHKIADFFSQENISHIVCVATEYGAEVLDNENVRIGRMTAEEMKAFFEESGAKIVVDATHPYADKVTENIKKSCRVKYIRVAREDIDADGKNFKNVRQAVDYLADTNGNILITTGSKEIAEFAPIKDRAFARVLPSQESLRLCLDAGFEPKRIICMQGPFSKEFNSALLRELDIKYLVTKRTGKSGGFPEKVEAAKENGVECVIIERPVIEDGVTVTEAENLILEWL